MKRCSPAAEKLLFFLPFVSKVQLFQQLLHESLKLTPQGRNTSNTKRIVVTGHSVIVTFCSVYSELIVILLFIPYNHIFQEEEYVNDS